MSQCWERAAFNPEDYYSDFKADEPASISTAIEGLSEWARIFNSNRLDDIVWRVSQFVLEMDSNGRTELHIPVNQILLPIHQAIASYLESRGFQIEFIIKPRGSYFYLMVIKW